MNWYDDRKHKMADMVDNQGMSFAEVANYYGLTRQTVRNILGDYKRRKWGKHSRDERVLEGRAG